MNGLGLSSEAIAERRKRIHAGDAELVMAGHWNLLWRIKTGRAEEGDFYDGLSWHIKSRVSREQMELRRLMGLYTEPFNLAYCQRETGRKVTYFSGNPLMHKAWATLTAGTESALSDMELQVSGDYPFMACNLDAMTTTPQGEPMALDAKTISRAGDAATLTYTAAGTHQATVMGTDFWGLSILSQGKWDLIIQPVDPLYQAKLISMERTFWGYVERGEEPEDRTEPAPPPKPQPKRREIIIDLTPESERPNWSGEFIRLARTFADTDGAAKLNAITRREMDALIPEDVGLAQAGLVRAKRDGRGFSVTLDKEKADG